MSEATLAPTATVGLTAIARPSRAEIETLCLLDVVGRGASAAGEIADRLGLARDLAPAVEEAVRPLVAIGHLGADGEILSLTVTGREWLRRRLGELGCLEVSAAP